MLDINLNGALPTHVDRIKPKISVDKSGKINWVPGYLDYNASNYFPGKTVKSEEFNKHNLQQVYQGNYITDVLQLIFDKHLPDAVYKLFTSEFNLAPSFVKTFTADDWGEKQEDGYYYITVTAEEHGFPADTAEGVLERMNIDTEMYLLNPDGNFYEVQQISTASDNTVQAYSDDNTLVGFLVIRTNDKAYALAEASIHASQIVGLADSALSGKYADLVDLTRSDGTGPDDRITANAKGIASILSGVDDDNKVVKVAKALQADNAKEASAMLGTGTLGGRIIDNIFEVGSNTVKKATVSEITTNAVTATNATNATNAVKDTSGAYLPLTLNSSDRLKLNNTYTIPLHRTIYSNITGLDITENGYTFNGYYSSHRHLKIGVCLPTASNKAAQDYNIVEYFEVKSANYYGDITLKNYDYLVIGVNTYPAQLKITFGSSWAKIEVPAVGGQYYPNVSLHSIEEILD